MRDLMVTCFSEHAVKVSETTCSSTYIPTITNINPANQNSVVYLYKTTLSSFKHFLITVTWCRNGLGQGGLTINFGDENDPVDSFKLNTFSRLFHKKKGHKSFENSKIDVFWDLSSVTYQTGPEPVDEYYILVNLDSELVLALGDLAQEAVAKRLRGTPTPWPKWGLVSRREYYSGNTMYYCTKVQFCESGGMHDIVIRCSEDRDKGNKQPVLYVSIDKKSVIKVKRLQWNFRGNQTVFVDGLLIDLMWDVHDWFFNPVTGFAVFMFKTRIGGESRLWLEDKSVSKDDDRVDFSLMLYASKNP